MAGVTITGVRKSFGAVPIIHGIDLDIADGELVVFVGPSGCGKTTLLRMIAGLEDIDTGSIAIGGAVVNDVAPAKRGVAMVFQTYALYPHMTVYNNMAFGLRQAKTPPAEVDRRVREAAQALQLTDYLTRNPRHLSGGQRQRVAIGRAIVRAPEVFLFDEPLSNLDAALRVQTRLEIARLHQRLGATMIYVTHDQVEAMTLADKIVVLRNGCIEQVGAPLELYVRPQNIFVARFIGSPQMNIFAATDLGASARAGMLLGVRPEHLHILPPPGLDVDDRATGDEAPLVSGRLELIEQLGEYAIAHLTTATGTEFTVKLQAPPTNSIGHALDFTAAAEHLHWFDEQSGARVD